jgi:hypothetical protein
MARRKGISMSALLAEAGRAALRAETEGEPPPFVLVTYGSGGPLPGVDLDRTSELIAGEDEATFRK